MEAKRQVPVDMGELEIALQTDAMEMQAYLDLETGQVVWVMDEFRRKWEAIWDELLEGEDPLEALEAYLAEQDDIIITWQKDEIRQAARVEEGYMQRYLSIDPEPYSDYNDMERFIWRVEDDGIAAELENAIRGRGAFRYFKDVLARYPEVREAWYAFKDSRIEMRVRDWLEHNAIEPIDSQSKDP